MNARVRDVLRAALERCASRSLDSEDDRAAVLEVVASALASMPEAARLRAAWAEAPTGCGKLVVMRAAGGRIEAELLSCAAVLAQCPEVLP